MNSREHHPLNLVNVTLEYPDGDGTLKALDAVNLRVDAGEFFSLVGPSGSGKSSPAGRRGHPGPAQLAGSS